MTMMMMKPTMNLLQNEIKPFKVAENRMAVSSMDTNCLLKNLYDEITLLPTPIGGQPSTTKRHRTKKRVRFAPLSSLEDTAARRSPPLTKEDCTAMWYQTEELAAIKHEAKVILMNRTKQKTQDSSTREKMTGLERFSKQRAIWKRSSIHYVLTAQQYVAKHNLPKEEIIRKVSLRCTEWARHNAEQQGFQDYCAVHDPLEALFRDDNSNVGQNYNELFFGESGDMNETTSTSSHKRRRQHEGSTAHDERRIRQRIANAQ